MPSELPHLAALRDRLLRRFLVKIVFGDQVAAQIDVAVDKGDAFGFEF